MIYCLPVLYGFADTILRRFCQSPRMPLVISDAIFQWTLSRLITSQILTLDYFLKMMSIISLTHGLCFMTRLTRNVITLVAVYGLVERYNFHLRAIINSISLDPLMPTTDRFSTFFLDSKILASSWLAKIYWRWFSLLNYPAELIRVMGSEFLIIS